jgi:alanine racemase
VWLIPEKLDAFPKKGIKTRPYILGATLQSEREEIAACGWTPCLCSFEEIEHFNHLGKDSPIEAHLALDTGMGRGGFLPDQLGEALQKLKASFGNQANRSRLTPSCCR